MAIERKELNCIIDTVQVRTGVNNIKDYFDKLDIKQDKSYITPLAVRATKLGIFPSYKINLNSKKGFGVMKSLKQYEEELWDTMEKMEIINPSIVVLERIDIAIDSPMDFFDNFKFLSMFFELCVNSVVHKGSRSSWYSVNMETLQESSLRYKQPKNGSYEIEFYDKNAQSAGRHLYNTRMEFRLLRKRTGIEQKDLEKHLNTVIERVENVDGFIPLLENDMANRLKMLWKREVRNGRIKNFSDFVRKHSEFFYTKNILEEVYTVSGLAQGKSSCTNWLKSFRKSNTLAFYCKSDIVKFKKEIIKVIKGYIKGLDK